MYPGQIFREAVSVLHFVRRQKCRAANLVDVVKRQLRQTAVSGHVRDSGETAGEVQQLFTGFIRIDLLAL